MDFDQAVAAHAAWKIKLGRYLKNPDGSLQASELSQDNKCALGEWIYGEGGKYAKLPDFSKLQNEHARFHKAVGDVVRRANSGQSVTQETSLGSQSEFMQASMGVVAAIVNLKKHVEQAMGAKAK
jgi:hypothetical protein